MVEEVAGRIMEEAASMFKCMKVELAKLEVQVHVFTLEWDTLSDGGSC